MNICQSAQFQECSSRLTKKKERSKKLVNFERCAEYLTFYTLKIAYFFRRQWQKNIERFLEMLLCARLNDMFFSSENTRWISPALTQKIFGVFYRLICFGFICVLPFLVMPVNIFNVRRSFLLKSTQATVQRYNVT